MERRRRRGRALPPAALVQPRPAEQPHPPQAAGRRRPGRLHRRRRHRRPVDAATRRTPTTGATPTTASRARWWRRCRRCSSTTGCKATGKVLHGEAYFPPLQPAGDAAGADVQQLAQRRQREHAADVPAVDRRGAQASIDLASAYFVPDELAVDALVAARQARREGAHHHARRAHRCRDRAPRLARACGATCCEAGVEIYEYQPTMYHCKVMVVDDLLVVGRLDQLRQPLVPRSTTRPTSTCSTRGFAARAVAPRSRRTCARSRRITLHALAAAALARKADRAGRRAFAGAALSLAGAPAGCGRGGGRRSAASAHANAFTPVDAGCRESPAGPGALPAALPAGGRAGRASGG